MKHPSGDMANYSWHSSYAVPGEPSFVERIAKMLGRGEAQTETHSQAFLCQSRLKVICKPGFCTCSLGGSNAWSVSVFYDVIVAIWGLYIVATIVEFYLFSIKQLNYHLRDTFFTRTHSTNLSLSQINLQNGSPSEARTPQARPGA